MDHLKSISPQDARELYYEERKDDASYSSLTETIRPGIDLFTEWCEHAGIKNLNNLGGRQLIEYKNWCKETTENKKVSLNGLLGVLRRFLVFCVKIDAVAPTLPDKVPISNLPDDEEVSYEKPSDEQVEQVIQYLEQYEPASRRHVQYVTMMEIGDRVGSLRGIDIIDVDLEKQVIKFRHRPEKEFDCKGTPLKNKNDGEREVNISSELADLIRRYLNNPDRHDVTDKFDRKPLLTTKSGRPTVDTIRRDLYKLTRPCKYAGTCPHNKDIDTCKAVQNAHASECPSSHSPHPLRRWSIEHQIDRGVPKDQLADRVDVSIPVLNKHYDTRSEERKRKQRLEIMEKLFEGYGDSDATLNSGELDALTNDDGMIDAVALKQLINAEDLLRDTLPASETDASDDSEDEPQDENQSSFDDFTNNPAAISQPILAPLIGSIVAAQWIPDRLSREIDALTPASEPSSWPTGDRVAKGVAAYTLYVGLIAVNLNFLGLLPA